MIIGRPSLFCDIALAERIERAKAQLVPEFPTAARPEAPLALL
jgi:hypothetical protein